MAKALFAALAIFIGVALALAALNVAFALAGGGHGWVAPIFFSFPLFVLYPAAFLQVAYRTPFASAAGRVLVAVAVIADVALIAMTALTEARYFHAILNVAPEVVFIWLVLWSLWQLFAIIGMVRRWDTKGYND
jgi:hypothetical protein